MNYSDSKPTSITIEISQTIRAKPYETIKPTISMVFPIPSRPDLDMAEFYREKYKEVKKIWNLHLYNILFDVSRRNKLKDVFEHAKNLVIGGETFPTFKKKPKKEATNNG